MECPRCKAEIDEGLAVCSQCNHSLEKEKTAKKIYWLATLSVSCFLAVVAVYIAAILIAVFGIDVGNAVEEFYKKWLKKEEILKE